MSLGVPENPSDNSFSSLFPHNLASRSLKGQSLLEVKIWTPCAIHRSFGKIFLLRNDGHVSDPWQFLQKSWCFVFLLVLKPFFLNYAETKKKKLGKKRMGISHLCSSWIQVPTYGKTVGKRKTIHQTFFRWALAKAVVHSFSKLKLFLSSTDLLYIWMFPKIGGKTPK